MAIVVGLDDIRGVHAARTLASYGIEVIGISRSPRAYAARTKACRRVFYADTRNEEFVELLEELGSTFPMKPVLVPCLDMAALQISRHRARITSSYAITLSSPDVVETLMDKERFYRFAQAEGLAIPTTCFMSQRDDIERVVSTLRFPCVVKPPNSKAPEWLERTRSKAFRVDTPAEIVRLFDTYHDIANPLIVQEWIEGPETSLYACHCYFDASSQLLVSFTSRKIRQWPPRTGQGCLAEEVRNDTVRDITIDLFRRVGFRGLGYLEVKHDMAADDYRIVEPNIGRVSGRMAIAEAGGVELLYTMYCESAGLPLPERREQRYVGAKWIYLRQDLQSSFYYMRRRELTPIQWIRSLRGRKRFALLSASDPGPFLAELSSGFRTLIAGKKTTPPAPQPVADGRADVAT